MRRDQLQLLNTGGQIFNLLPVDESELIYVVEVKAGVGDEALAQLAELMLMMEVLDGLFEADGDEEAEDYCGDVDEEVAPGGSGVVGGVDVEHGGWFLWGLEGCGGVFGLRRLEGWRRVMLGHWRLIWRAIGHRLLR